MRLQEEPQTQNGLVFMCAQDLLTPTRYCPMPLTVMDGALRWTSIDIDGPFAFHRHLCIPTADWAKRAGERLRDLASGSLLLAVPPLSLCATLCKSKGSCPDGCLRFTVHGALWNNSHQTLAIWCPLPFFVLIVASDLPTCAATLPA